MIARALVAMCLVMSLAACAGAAQQDATTQPAEPKALPPLRTGGPQPPQRAEDNSCKIDADCKTKRDCAEYECRCVQDKCIRLQPALDPAIDPAPPASVR